MWSISHVLFNSYTLSLGLPLLSQFIQISNLDSRYWAMSPGHTRRLGVKGNSAISKSAVFPEHATAGLTISKYAPLKADLKKAGYRIVAKQALTVTHGAIVNSLRNKDGSATKANALSEILGTEYGKAAMAITLGIAIPQIPGVDSPDASANMLRLLALSKEFRVSGMTIAGNELIETIFKSALEVMLNQSEESKVRVASEDTSDLEDHLLAEEESVENKKLSA